MSRACRNVVASELAKETGNRRSDSGLFLDPIPARQQIWAGKDDIGRESEKVQAGRDGRSRSRCEGSFHVAGEIPESGEEKSNSVRPASVSTSPFVPEFRLA